ncbi:MAG: sugar phosphate isomerase/epimerase [candidate division NC10 bacterium]|nr:sugar phosphate isomerase/epimerase [candidate division NC10 bacterium]
MNIVLNSKFFNTLSIPDLGAKAQELRFDGIDVNVRPGHPVNPNNVETALPEAVAIWQEQGLICPLATAPVTLVNPAAPEVEPLYAGCAAAGVPRVKIGFFSFNPGDDYWVLVDAARVALEGFARVGERYGVQTVYQVHSGPVLGSNCAGVMHLLRGFDPRWVGAYPDLGHMVLDGEDYALGLAMVRDYLSIVAVKDAYHAPEPEGSEPPFVPRFVKLGTGAVNWRRALSALKALGFDGVFSVHTEYSFDEAIIRQVGYADTTPPNLEEWAKADAAYLRKVWEEV